VIRTVGVVGLGIMGTAIVANLIEAGFRVIGYDVDRARVEALEARGGQAAASCAEAAQAAELVITSLPSAAALEAVVGGADGLLASAKRGLIVVETSTLPIEAKQQAHAALGGAGIALLDCPLSGTGAQAATRDLVVLASGEPELCERCRPVFEAFARSTRYIGAFGTGSVMKFVANLLVAVHNVAAAEAFVLGMKAGLDPQTIYEVIADGAGSSRMFEVRGPMMAAGCYLPATMKAAVFQKDIDIITRFAESLGSPTPLFGAASRIYAEVLRAGMAGSDTAAVCEVLERQAGLKRS
jgi:3-hydroxyisobutyrate dehydrogenase-like beta-hydroxyacid dehydrogenase